jgi:hypothetical protein
MARDAELQAALRSAGEARYRLLATAAKSAGWPTRQAGARRRRASSATRWKPRRRWRPLLAQLPARLARYAEGDLSRRRLLREAELPHADGHPVPVEIEPR